MFAAITSPILPIIIANSAAQSVHSEAGAWGAIAGLAVLAIVVLVFIVIGVRWTILDFIENHRPERKAALAQWDAIYAAKRAKVARDGEALREYLAKNAK